jgi:16S rRNA (guanine966-N2)-methyltransferase
MKHRVREAVFDLLGPSVEGCWAIDLFAGTGALGLEAISRGAVGATLVERHIPTAKLIQKSAADLGVAERAEVIMASAMVWAQRGKFPAGKWLVFCSPPYDFYVERSQDMLDLIRTMVDSAPAASTLVVEADERLDESTLPRAADWRVRRYPPAVIALLNVEN